MPDGTLFGRRKKFGALGSLDDPAMMVAANSGEFGLRLRNRAELSFKRSSSC